MVSLFANAVRNHASEAAGSCNGNPHCRHGRAFDKLTTVESSKASISSDLPRYKLSFPEPS